MWLLVDMRERRSNMAASSRAHLLLFTVLLMAIMFLVSQDSKIGATATAEEQRATIITTSNSTTIFSPSCNEGDQSYNCQIIAYVQPNVELGLEIVARRSLIDSSTVAGRLNNNRNAAGCGRDKPPPDRYFSCTTDPAKGNPNPQSCNKFTRDNPCSQWVPMYSWLKGENGAIILFSQP